MAALPDSRGTRAAGDHRTTARRSGAEAEWGREEVCLGAARSSSVPSSRRASTQPESEYGVSEDTKPKAAGEDAQARSSGFDSDGTSTSPPRPGEHEYTQTRPGGERQFALADLARVQGLFRS